MCPTPERWLQAANARQAELLIDHANCEKKAASAAMGMLYRYPQHGDLLQAMSRLARQELRHFEQVLQWMKRAGIEYSALSASRYAATLHERVRRGEPERLIDLLAVGALVEARSCERFLALEDVLEDRGLAAFYRRLAQSEAHHEDVYLTLGHSIDREAFTERLGLLQQLEAELVSTPDEEFRFHSGPP